MGSKPRKSTSERFWEKVDRSGDGCWEWQGGVKSTEAGHDYGKFRVDGKKVFAHRFSYALTYGPIPPDMCVCHRCDNPRCVRPDHLFLGTRTDNMLDMHEKGRHPSAALTPEQRSEIRRRYVRGKVGCKRLAAEFGVHFMSVWELVQPKGQAKLPKAA